MQNDSLHVETTNAYSEEYVQALEKVKDICPFCPGQMKVHKHPIEMEGEHWLVTKNSYNYLDAKYPYLFIHKTHINHLTELTVEAWTELNKLFLQIIEKYSIKGGTLFMRFGDPKMTGATVVHLHAHLVSADPDRENPKPIMARIG